MDKPMLVIMIGSGHPHLSISFLVMMMRIASKQNKKSQLPLIGSGENINIDTTILTILYQMFSPEYKEE